MLRSTLRKNSKLRFKAQFDQVRRDGVRFAGNGLVAVVASGSARRVECGVICGKKYSLLSVERNRARRLLWESFRLLRPALAGCRMVLIARRGMKDYSRERTGRELAGLLVRAGVLPPEVADSPPGE